MKVLGVQGSMACLWGASARPRASLARRVVLVQALFDEPAHLLVLHTRQRVAVGTQSFVAAAEPAEHVGTGKVERYVVLQSAGGCEAVEQLQSLERACSERDRNRAVQLDDGGSLVAQELVVEHTELGPIGRCGGWGLGVDGGDRTLDLIRAGAPHAERLLDERGALFDLGAVPLRSILILEQDEI